jgi:hypothetical protein
LSVSTIAVTDFEMNDEDDEKKSVQTHYSEAVKICANPRFALANPFNPCSILSCELKSCELRV